MTLQHELADWTRGSRRFRAFVDAHADKIGKKLRVARDAEAARDVRAELLAARLLLGDRRFELGYETYGVGNAGPDFTVTYRGAIRFNVEVTRLRGAPTQEAFGRTILAKLRQLPAGGSNVLLVAVDADAAVSAAAALSAAADAVRVLRLRADRKDEAFFERAGFPNARAFYERFLRLSGVIVWAEKAQSEQRAALWANASARVGLLGRAAEACLACLRADASLPTTAFAQPTIASAPRASSASGAARSRPRGRRQPR